MEPPNIPHPATAAKGLGSKAKSLPKWAWIAGAVVLIGVAWFTMKRQTSAAAPIDPADTDPGTVADSSIFPGPTQGAFSGADLPTLDGGGTNTGGNDNQPLAGDSLESLLTLMGFMSQHDSDLLAAVAPAPLATPLDASDTVSAAAAGTPAAVATGGGPPGRTVTTHTPPPENVVKDGKFYHVYNRGKGKARGERWVYIRPASTPHNAPAHPAATPTTHVTTPAHSTTTPAGVTTMGAHASAPPGFPFHGPHGWYRVENRGGHTYHVYQGGPTLRVR